MIPIEAREACGCEYNEGQWFACSSHNEWCGVCEVPVQRGSQGICADCLAYKEETCAS